MVLSPLPVLLGLLAAAFNPNGLLAPLDIYGVEEAPFFSRHRVRELVVLEQGYYKGQSSPRHTLAVQQFDRKGHVIKEWKFPNQGRFSTLEESTYDAAGRLTDRTSYENASPATDTSRLGTTWQPESRAHYAVTPGQSGYGERWNPQTSRWQRTETSRSWISHDTTYLQTTRLPDAAGGFLVRTYPIAGGRTRIDNVMTGKWFLNDMLFEPQYSYIRQENGRQVEFGRLLFADELQRYLQQHPQLAKPEEGTEAYCQLLDQVARHAAGRAETLDTRTYDAQGRLLKDAAKFFFTTYQRDEQGRVQTTEEYSHNSPPTPPVRQRRSVFSYLPNGLVTREEVSEEINGLAAIRYYRYQYY